MCRCFWTLLTWLLYVCVYTPSKMLTPLNTLIGAVPGAMPMLIGWSAADAPYDLRVVALYGVLFLWQFPHFMAIAWMYRRQYGRAGMQMLSVVDPTGRRAGRHALWAASALVPVSLLPTLFISGAGGWAYGAAACVLSLCQAEFRPVVSAASHRAGRAPAAALLAPLPAGAAPADGRLPLGVRTPESVPRSSFAL